MKRILIVSICLFLACRGMAQGFEKYEQQIPGSEVVIKMVPIAGGEFLMGSPAGEAGRKSDEGPQKRVKVNGFWMGAYEITFDQYDLFADAEKDSEPIPDAISRPSPPYIDLTLGMGKVGGYPANSMSRYAALMYCKWLFEKTGVFFRLPTEAEWEYAARAGSNTAYFFGEGKEMLKDYAWYNENSGDKYHKVGELRPNPWGLYDIYGNMAEWTMDRYDPEYFKKIGSDNPLMVSEGKVRNTLKGGNYKDGAQAVRSAARLESDPDWNRRDPQIPKSKWWNADAPFIGFRIVRPLKQPSAEEIAHFFEEALNQK